MKRERLLQVFLAVLGLLFIALIYPLYIDLRHAMWLLEMHNETEPMFLSCFIALGPFLLIAAKRPIGTSLADCLYGLVVSGARCRAGAIQVTRHGGVVFG
jgi:hypothetical protein